MGSSSLKLNPSFSSTLLDSIYRSFDQCQDDLTTNKLGGCPTSLNRTKSCNNGGFHGSDLTCRNSDAAAASFGRKSTTLKNCYSHGGGEKVNNLNSLRPKPIRTRISDDKANNVNKLITSHDRRRWEKPKHDGKFSLDQNSGDSKRGNKTPVSPAARLAIFLNSLFAVKKTKSSPISGVGRSENASESSSARSCLSKHTRPLSSRINNAGKRTEIDEDDDLFELDNLWGIGKERCRYGEELPVYETTHLCDRRALANGLLL
nr:protein big grain 1-like B [Ipomoea batatas]